MSGMRYHRPAVLGPPLQVRTPTQPVSTSKPAATPTALLPSFLGGDVVNVLVGEGDKQNKFCVHRQLLSHHSKWFEAALNGAFKEATQDILELKEDPVDTFSLFVHWLYAGSIPPNNELEHPANRSYTTTLLRLHILADKYIVSGLQALTYSRLRQRFKPNRFPSTPFCTELSDDLPSSSKLRRYIVEVCAYLFTHQTPEHEWSKALDVSDAFAAEVARAMVQLLTDNSHMHPYDDEYFNEFEDPEDSTEEDTQLSLAPTSRVSKRKRDSLEDTAQI